MSDRLLLIYRLHLPPALLDSEIEELNSPTKSGQRSQEIVSAVEVMDFEVVCTAG